jgi:hypothetical protein
MARVLREAGLVPIGIGDPHEDPRDRALRVARHRNTGPQCQERPARRIDARRTR